MQLGRDTLLLPMELLLSARLRGVSIRAFSLPMGPDIGPAFAAAGVRVVVGGGKLGEGSLCAPPACYVGLPWSLMSWVSSSVSSPGRCVLHDKVVVLLNGGE